MEKTKLSPDPIRDAPKGHGSAQAPGGIAVLPGRSIVDERFNRFPMAIRVLAFCCGHAKTYTATFFVNQKTMATKMQCSQQSVSQHMRRLVDYGYLEKLRREDNRREWGKQGALWRVIFDPTMSFKQVMESIPSDAKSEEDEVIDMTETMTLAARGPKGHMTRKKATKQPVDNFKANKPQLVDTPRANKVQLVYGNKPQLVSKQQEVTIRREVREEECIRLCNEYSQKVYEQYGKPWKYDMRQLDLARDILQSQTSEAFLKDAVKLLTWMHSKGKQPVQSLQYFIVRRDKAKEPVDAQAILSKVTNRMKVR
tara:strand:- start:857 stop:1789 length:933 start_codon:yes stop_codon:yes gene_type:complete